MTKNVEYIVKTNKMREEKTDYLFKSIDFRSNYQYDSMTK